MRKLHEKEELNEEISYEDEIELEKYKRECSQNPYFWMSDSECFEYDQQEYGGR